MAEDFDLEQLVHLEQTFYDDGYTDGFAHGRIHGLIEGRALGREKGFEIWEEIGFYEGFALTWQAIYAQQADTDQRTVHHIKHLLELIQQFPRVNPSDPKSYGLAEEVDMEKLQRLIRSRYKALCACLGVRPTLRAELSSGDRGSEGDGPDARRTLTRQVWALEEDTKRPTMHGLSF
ncbi:hypothetical protein EDD15DRAFT_296580 [Pisolithus albus]|nr:hypothetical protein EDD15DRAFT_296580 [Pisolithus albus]